MWRGRALGVRRGDRVALLGANSDRLHESLLSVPWADAVVVPINHRCGYEIPRKPEFVASIPRNVEFVASMATIGAGKVLKRQLREERSVR
jgi:acyl-CoA synthetase (AMP-forming)/AMP-acid ligase II